MPRPRSSRRSLPTRARTLAFALAGLAALVLPAVALSGSLGASSSSSPGLTPAQAEKRSKGYLLPHPDAYLKAKQVPPGQAKKAQKSASAHPKVAWQGLTDATVTPPDSTGAIGTTRYVELVNLKYAIYNRTGGLLASGGLDTLTGDSIDGLSDPQVIWDPGTSRFYYAVLDYLSDNFEVGFSKTDSPSSASDFCKYDVDFGYGSDLPDYPKLGDTADFLLIGSNVFGGGLFFDRSDVAWLGKPAAGTITTCPAKLSSGWPLLTGVKQDLRNANNSQADTPVPANQTDGSSTGWVVSAYDGGNQLNVFQVTKNVNGTANIAGTGTAISVSSFAPPPSAVQKGTSEELDTLDARLTQAVSAVDPAHGTGVAIWTQHTVAGGAGSQVRWYEINPAGANLFQFGTVSSGSLYVFNGAISPDRVVNGATMAFGSNMALGFNTSSSNAYSAIQMVTKIGTGAQSSFQLIKQSTAPNIDFSCNSFFGEACRWGDYAGATPDPAANTAGAGGQVWFSNQFNKSGSNSDDVDWQTWNWSTALGAGGGGAPTITSFNPTSGPIGSQVTITGTNFTNVTAVALAKGTYSKAATFTVNSPTQITATVPSGLPTGVTANWSVTTSAGSATSATLFTITSGGGGGGGGGAPTISGFNPTSGPPGSQVVITGTNFTNVTAVQMTNSFVSLNVAYTVNSPTQITATVPSGAPHGATARWKVTTTAGSVTSAGIFTVT
jgi:hypothetical protein